MNGELGGKFFLSYKRDRIDEVRRLIEALHLLGVPTWQDVEDLGSGLTEKELRATIAEGDFAGAILWLTPEVEDSPMIQRVEVPEIFARARREPRFAVLPVAAGGIDYAEAADLVATSVTEDLSGWNVSRAGVSADDVTDQEVRRVAEKALRGRLRWLKASAVPDEPVSIGVFTFPAARWRARTWVALDWF